MSDDGPATYDELRRRWREDTAGLAAEAGDLRALVGEIIGRFEPHCDAHDCTGAVAEADKAEISRWRERAGLET